MKMIAVSFLLFILVGIINAQTSIGKGTVSGRVTYNGKGVADIIVSLRPETSGSQSHPSREAQTNREGEYRFDNLLDGSYSLEVSSTNQYTRSQSNFGFSSKNVVIENGDTASNIDFVLILGGVITGTVKDARGKPLIEAQIELFTVHENNGEAFTSSVSISNQADRQTDDRGVYRIYGVPVGRYIVSARPRQSRGEQDRVFHPATKEVPQAKLIEITEGIELSAIDITFPPKEKGHVVTGRVVDEQGKPVSNLLVRYIRYEMPVSGDQSHAKHLSSDQVQTDEEGKFVFNGVLVGKYSFFANSFTEPKYTEPALIEISQTNIEDLELKLIKGARLRGRIIVEGGDSTDDLTKLFLSGFSLTQPLQLTNRAISAKIQPNRNYEMDGLLAGRVHLSISDTNNQYHLLRIERNGALVEGGVNVKAGETITNVNIILSTGRGTVKGQVLFQGMNASGICLSMLAERITYPDGKTPYDLAQTDAQGRFIFDRLPPGEYDLVTYHEYAFPCGAVAVPKFPPVRQRVRIVDKQEQRVVIKVKLDGQ
jgi:protocatechuate 3,4-dioxygenase beta subunit